MADYLSYAAQSLDALLRQRLEDRLKAQDRAEKIRQFNIGAGERSRGHDLLQRQQDLADAQRRDVLAEQTRQHEGQRAERIASTAYPEDIATPEAQSLLQKTGFGGALRTVSQDPFEGVDASRLGELPLVSGRLRGGSQYLNAEQNRLMQERLAQEKIGGAREAAQAKADAAQQQNNIVNAIRQGNLEVARGNAGTQALLAQSTIGKREEEIAAKRAKVTEAENQLRSSGEQGLQTLQDLLTPEGGLTPGAQYRVGVSSKIPAGIQSILPGVDSRAAEAALAQLVSKQTLNSLVNLRRSSPTGGALGNVSDKDMKVLENASTILGQRNLPEAVVLRELKNVQAVFRKMAGAGQDLGADWGNK